MTMPEYTEPEVLRIYNGGVAIARQEAYERGYNDGDRDGHRRGWNQCLQRINAHDARLARGVVDELRRRDLEDEHQDTTDAHDWVSALCESLDAKARRDAWDTKVRAERDERGRG